MNKSISFYYALFLLKFKGIKKIFTQSFIDYEKLRKMDVPIPKNKFFATKKGSTFFVAKSKITEISSAANSNQLIVFIHGGAFVSGPAQYHWDAIEKMAKATDYTIWMCAYPKAPEHKIFEISNNIDLVYELATKKYSADSITLVGDSAGGTLIIALVQRLIQKGGALPSKTVLISPALNASFENPKIDTIDKKDPFLSKKGVLSAMKMCVDDDDFKNPNISPIYGSFKGFPPTFLFIAERDITYPDQLLFHKELENAKVKNTVFVGEGMLHNWPLLPIIKESKIALNKLIAILKQ